MPLPLLRRRSLSAGRGGAFFLSSVQESIASSTVASGDGMEKSKVNSLTSGKNGMKELEARNLVEQIRELCKKNGLWITITEEHKPNLAMIRVEEISIKVDK
jgi:hypothetical protein